MIQCKNCGGWPKSSSKCNICGHNMNSSVKEEAPPIKPRTPINKVSKKQKIIISESKKVHKEMAETLPKVCSGCGEKKPLSHSHLIPRSQRPELQNHPMNQVYHCLEVCHPIWEHDKQLRKGMIDYEMNMEKIRILDEQYYNLLINKHGL